MAGRARLVGPRPGGGFKWCVFPCQKLGEDGQKIARECRVPLYQLVGLDGKPAKRSDGTIYPFWAVTGPPDAPTLSPSVDCQSSSCWHGHIVNGEVRP